MSQVTVADTAVFSWMPQRSK